MPFKVIVADNFHYMDESESYTLGLFHTLEEAVAASKCIVDEFLAAAFKPEFTATQLYEHYVAFGEDPFIVSSTEQGVLFSAWDYARERCKKICQPAESR